MKLIHKIVFGAILLAIVSLYFTLSKKGAKKRAEEKQRIKESRCTSRAKDTIFVSIPSYRDPECADTLFSIFKQAECPHRIFVGLCIQDTLEDPDPLEKYEEMARKAKSRSFISNIRVIRIPADKATGPGVARHHLEKDLYKSEKYLLRVDSHTRFIKDWDSLLVQNFDEIKNRYQNDGNSFAKIIITEMPRDFQAGMDVHKHPWLNTDAEDGFDKKDSLKPFQDEATIRLPPQAITLESYAEDGCPILGGLAFKKLPTSFSYQSLFCTSRFLFGLANSILSVPYDPFMPYLFTEDDISMSTRLWTHGFNFYTPVQSFVFHKYDRSLRFGTFWENWSNNPTKIAVEAKSKQRFQLLIKTLPPSVVVDATKLGVFMRDGETYGMGKERDLFSYFSWSGMVPIQRASEMNARLGVSTEAGDDEITCRFGSRAGYEQHLYIMTQAEISRKGVQEVHPTEMIEIIE